MHGQMEHLMFKFVVRVVKFTEVVRALKANASVALMP